MLPHTIQQFATSSNSDMSFHSDTIHHVEFDFYGQRVVTVSSDKMVCIWDKDSRGNWRKSASWKKHGGAIWKARFAHPEYGQMLATCSFDNTIQIFDKDAADGLDTRPAVGGPDSSNGWVCRVVLRQSTSSITDIQFAPHYLGLQLAACTSSGRIIIYEAEDIMALDNWNVLFDEMVCAHRLSSLSWSTNRFDPPHIVASSDDVDATANEKLFIFRFNSSNGLIRCDFSLSEEEEDGTKRQYFQFADQVNMVLFGPSCGISTHKLAVAVGAKIIIYQLATTTYGGHNNNGGNGQNNENGGRNEYEEESEFIVKGCDVLEEGTTNSQVVRFSWNLLGDVISAVHADGFVRIWRYIFANQWAPISAITPPAENERNAKDDVYY